MDYNAVIHIVDIVALYAIENLDVFIRSGNLCLGGRFHGIREGLGYTVVCNGNGPVAPGCRLLYRSGGICQGIHIAHGGM